MHFRASPGGEYLRAQNMLGVAWCRERDAIMKGQFDQTQTFRVVPEEAVSVRALLLEVYQALREKGYNPTNQLVGYLMSGDPTYITSHKGARNLVRKLERDEIIEELVRYYLEGR